MTSALNIFGPETIPQLNEIVTALETDKDVQVVVLDSAIQGSSFGLITIFWRPLEDSTHLPPGPTGLQPLPDMLVRLSRAPVASIATARRPNPDEIRAIFSGIGLSDPFWDPHADYFV